GEIADGLADRYVTHEVTVVLPGSVDGVVERLLSEEMCIAWHPRATAATVTRLGPDSSLVDLTADGAGEPIARYFRGEVSGRGLAYKRLDPITGVHCEVGRWQAEQVTTDEVRVVLSHTATIDLKTPAGQLDPARERLQAVLRTGLRRVAGELGRVAVAGS